MKRPATSDTSINKYIDYLEAQIAAIRENPILDSYLTLRSQIRDFNVQLDIKEDRKGAIDIFSDKEDKSFDRAKWYFSELPTLHKNLKALWDMMTSEEQASAKKSGKKGGIAEQLASQNGNP